MQHSVLKFFLLFALVCNVFAVTVETLDEQVYSRNLTSLRLRLYNETDKALHDVSVKYFIKKQQDSIVIEEYDLAGTRVSLEPLNENIWVVKISIDSLPPGIFPYEAGICLGIHDINWQTRDKSLDPSYIASSNFVINKKVELNIEGNHLPDAVPLAFVSGTKILLNRGDSVSFAWHAVPNAGKYRLRIFTADTQLIYQKETYENRDAVPLDTGTYLWKVNSKNPTTDYDEAGSGGLLNYLEIAHFDTSIIKEEWSHCIRSVSGHKDTPMLVVEWGEYADLREWDRPHLGRTFLDELENSACWAIAIKNLNQLNGGNLSLDEIRWYAKKSSSNPIKAFPLKSGGPYDICKAGLNFALDSTADYNSISNTESPLTFDVVKYYISKDKEIFISMRWPDGSAHHVMLIDSYYITATENFVRCVNVDNLGHSEVFLADSLFKTIAWYIIIDSLQTVRGMSPLLGVEKYENQVKTIKWTDSDGDGITDFDEIYRFGTNPYSADSDSDKVNDKDEIYSYTILENGNLDSKKLHSAQDWTHMLLIDGIDNEYMADVDGDGLRAELDPDSDNDGLLDGDDPEPYKANTVKDSQAINELPKDVILYARKQLYVNDGSDCMDPLHTHCIYASEGTESEYGIIMGANVASANLYAKNKVLIRDNPNYVFSVNYYGPNDLATIRDDGKMTVERHFKATEWPWELNISLPSFNEGDSILVVQRGDTCFLSSNIHLKKLKVESGGVVYLPVGNVYVGDLHLDSGSKISFENQKRSTVIFVKNFILWRSKFIFREPSSFEDCSAKFKLVYSGSDRVFLDVNWYGTVIAPNAEIIFGQTHEKNFYGQIYANKIIVHQYSYLFNVPFNPEQESMDFALKEKK